MLFLLFPGIGNQLLHHIKVHQRFTTEEVHLQVSAALGIGNQKIQCLLADFKAHHGAVTVIVALAGKAVAAVQVAGMCHVQAQRLDHAAGASFQLAGHGSESIGGKELAHLFQLRNLIAAIQHLGLGDFGMVGIFFQHCPDDLFGSGRFVQTDDVVGYLIHYVDRAGIDIQHDAEATQFITVNHSSFPAFCKSL